MYRSIKKHKKILLEKLKQGVILLSSRRVKPLSSLGVKFHDLEGAKCSRFSTHQRLSGCANKIAFFVTLFCEQNPQKLLISLAKLKYFALFFSSICIFQNFFVPLRPKSLCAYMHPREHPRTAYTTHIYVRGRLKSTA